MSLTLMIGIHLGTIHGGAHIAMLGTHHIVTMDITTCGMIHSTTIHSSMTLGIMAMLGILHSITIVGITALIGITTAMILTLLGVTAMVMVRVLVLDMVLAATGMALLEEM